MKMQRGALYIRVSTDDQLEYSPDAQKSALLEYARKNRILIDPENIFIDEGISGRKAEKRPSFMNMIRLAKKKPRPFDAILVHKFDRFARSREDSVVYKSLLRKDCGVKVISITEEFQDDKMSVIMEAMLEAMAEYYSLNLAEEVTKGLTEKAKRGEHSGNCPFGYYMPRDSKIIAVNEEQRPIIETIFNKFVFDDWSLFEIAKHLNTLGYKTKYNSTFAKRTVKYILQNPVYCGLNRWNYRKGGQDIPNDKSEWIIEQGKHDPIISEELFEKAQQKLSLMKSQNKPKARPSTEYKHWLTGICRCLNCGNSMTATTVRQKYISFRCQKYNKGGCTTPNYISAAKLQELVLKRLEYDMYHMEELETEMLHINSDLGELQLLENQLSKVKRKYDLAKKAFLAEIDSLDEYKNNKELIQKEENEILEQMNEIKEKCNKKTSEQLFQKKFKETYDVLNSEDVPTMVKHKAASSLIKEIRLDTKNKVMKITYYR